ncbi:hypothetical protein D3C72_2101060 [compost metagenome]
MGGKPADHRREVANEVKAEEDQRRTPPVTAQHAFQTHRLAAVDAQVLQVLVQALVEWLVVDHQVGFKVQRQAQGVEIAGAHGRPVLVHQRHLAMQGPLAIFEDPYTVAQQVVVEQP